VGLVATSLHGYEYGIDKLTKPYVCKPCSQLFYTGGFFSLQQHNFDRFMFTGLVIEKQITPISTETGYRIILNSALQVTLSGRLSYGVHIFISA